MTHDELLARLSLENKNLVSYDEFEKRNSALCAVVKLHKETTFIAGQSYDKKYELRQQICLNCTDLTGKPVPYPCYNIQAIEKELK